MPIWEVVYFPAKGERNAPIDKLLELCNKTERSKFQDKINLLRELERQYWNFKWLKLVKGFYQLREGNFRGYLKLDVKKIVVLHVCRKVRQEAKAEDLKIAENNWEKYQKG